MRGLFLILLLVGLVAPAAAQYKGRVIGGAPVTFDNPAGASRHCGRTY